MANNTSEPTRTELVITTQTFLKTVLLVIGTILLLALLKQIAPALVILFTAFFLALALNAPVAWLARHFPGRARGNRVWGTSMAFLIVVIALSAFIASLVPSLINQTQNLITAAPQLVQDIQEQEGPIGELIARYNLQDQVNNLSSEISDRLQTGAGQLFSTFQQVGASFVTLLTVLTLTFMMLVEGPRRLQFLHELIPERHRKTTSNVAADMYKVVKGFVNGQVTLAALAAVLITPIFIIMDVSYPIGLTVIVFICGLIPMFGHTIGAILVSIVALFTSLPAALVVLAYYILYQQIENIILQPRVQANSTDMSPLLVFASVVVGISFGGLLGGLVAIPVAGCIRVALLEYLRTKRIVRAPAVKAEIETATGRTK